MFDITNYNQEILFFTFLICVLILLSVFKNKYNSLLDPITMHIFWISGNISFLTAFVYKFGFNQLSSLFLVFFCIYTLIVFLFLSNIKEKKDNTDLIEIIKNKERKIKIIFIIIALVYFFSRLPFFKYAMENPSIASWFLYRFVDLQGRDPILRILGTGAEVYFYFFSFLLLFILKKWKKFVLTALILALMIGVFSGGRSSVLSALIYLGAFIFYFNKEFDKKFIRKVNVMGSLMVAFAIFLAIVITSFYEEDASIMDGFSIIINRFIAVGDGLEYYMLYNGPAHIKSGFGEYLMAVFGVYVKQFSGGDYKNVGTQLTELVVGDVSFAQGSNFVFPLQSMVLGIHAWVFYIPLMAFLVAKMRGNRTRSFLLLPLSFFFSYHCFTIATDMEYAFLCIISGVIVYLGLIYPILKLKF